MQKEAHISDAMRYLLMCPYQFKIGNTEHRMSPGTTDNSILILSSSKSLRLESRLNSLTSQFYTRIEQCQDCCPHAHLTSSFHFTSILNHEGPWIDTQNSCSSATPQTQNVPTLGEWNWGEGQRRKNSCFLWVMQLFMIKMRRMD